MHRDIRELSQSNPKRTDSEGFINYQRKRYLSIEVNGLARHEGEYGKHCKGGIQPCAPGIRRFWQLVASLGGKDNETLHTHELRLCRSWTRQISRLSGLHAVGVRCSVSMHHDSSCV